MQDLLIRRIVVLYRNHLRPPLSFFPLVFFLFMPLVCRPWGAGLVPFDNSIDTLFSQISIVSVSQLRLFCCCCSFQSHVRLFQVRTASVLLLCCGSNLPPVLHVLQDNASSEEHVLYVWDHFVSWAEAKNVFIVAHSYGGLSFVELVSVFRFLLYLPPHRSLPCRGQTRRFLGCAVA